MIITMSSEEQLVQFFAYSFFVYPVTGWLVSPNRPYKRWKGALYAVLFLVLVSLANMAYDNREKGPNHYQTLGIPRGTPDSKLKQKYRQLSLKLHPDKNKAPNAAEEFRRVTQAYNVLQDLEKRKVYDKLGDAGVKYHAQAAVDHKYIMIQLLMNYASSVIFAFLMTFSDPSGDALSMSLFALLFMLLVESLLVLEEFQIPTWLLQYYTAHDVVSLLHRLFPALMNGGRSIIGAFQVDRKANRLEVLEALNATTQRVSLLTVGMVQDVLARQDGALESVRDEGIMAIALKSSREKVGAATSLTALESSNLIRDPSRLRRHLKKDESGAFFALVRNIVAYLALRFIFKNSIPSYADS